MRFALQILGANSAIPFKNRFPTAQILHHGRDVFLIDCGEGAQIKLSEFKIKRSRLKHIFISHLHGDHIFGLPGLVNSYQLQSRVDTLHIYGPTGIQKFLIQILELTSAHLIFDLKFHEFEPSRFFKLVELDNIEVYSIPLNHRIPCSGYLFKEKEHPTNIRSELITKYDLSIEQIKMLKQGEDILLSTGEIITNSMASYQKYNRRSYAYCSDTMYDTDLEPLIKNVNLLYHEATYLHDKLDLAKKTKHTTARQAALMAKKAQVKKLVIGHFSSRYDDLSPLLNEAREIFPDTALANEGSIFDIL